MAFDTRLRVSKTYAQSEADTISAVAAREVKQASPLMA